MSEPAGAQELTRTGLHGRCPLALTLSRSNRRQLSPLGPVKMLPELPVNGLHASWCMSVAWRCCARHCCASSFITPAVTPLKFFGPCLHAVCRRSCEHQSRTVQPPAEASQSDQQNQGVLRIGSWSGCSLPLGSWHLRPCGSVRLDHTLWPRFVDVGVFADQRYSIAAVRDLS